MKKEWIVSQAGRLDAALVREASLSRTQAQRLIKNRSIKVNGTYEMKAGTGVEEGDRLSFVEKKEAASPAHPFAVADLGLKALYEDDACFVFSKPAGLSVHPGAGTGSAPTLLSGLAHLFKTKKLPFSSEAVLVHRLDKNTTGCILVAKNPEAHRFLQKQFENRTVKKTYLALTAGVPKKSQALIDAPIGRNVLDRTKMSVFRTSRTREARTEYTVLAHSKDAALLSCDLLTGRTHQIRVHLNAIGHPILGDATYQSNESEELSKKVDGMCLHAWKLTFQSPAKKKETSVTCPLPSSFSSALKIFSLSLPSSA